ncbi:NAD(P)-dependent oxidoreductase [Raineyella sp.]|uniref:NAD-dependent epimerase/dehydratase family protein n=1 Tax=Raineyella sp. TaxID=1911550 RepID=UPI002B1FB5AA|nr:NAD(P)-dependent oxidoreductase [Raineyella sp.]MEA5153966.1 NAD(P)-dependent oxidoreductase [Raineyella sp.]
MKALITGGVGFIGQWTARRMASRGWDVVALDSLSPQVHADPDSAVRAFPGTVIRGDVTDRSVWRQSSRPDVVIHLAAETGTAQSMYEVERYRGVNVGGTRMAADQASEWGVPLVAMSSRAVYGEGRYRHPDGTVTFDSPEDPDASPEASRESDDHRPVSVYGETKSEAEALLTATARQIPVSVVRPQNVVGPGQALHNPYTGVLAAFLARMREGKPLLVYGDGLQTRDFVAVQDVAVLLHWLAEHPTPLGAVRTLNVGTGVRTAMNEIAEYALSGAPDGGHGIEHVDIHRAGDIIHACSDQSTSRELGAPQPAITTRDAVASFITWSWDKPGVSSQLWDDALQELADRGLSH